MPQYNRQRWRAACTIRTQLIKRRKGQLGQWVQAGLTPTTTFERHAHLQRRLQRAQQRQLETAAHRIRQQMAALLRDLRVTLDGVINQLNHPLPPLPSLRELMAELEALDEEFGEVTVDRAGRQLEVRTEPIELEGVYLGPFTLQLELTGLGQPGGSMPLYVVALDPNPAAGDSHVTHPHVSDERLCAGEAHPAMLRTLAEGRLSEFFLLVRSVLTTYNAASPYVSIDNWSGEPCDDCGVGVDEDERCTCDQCERIYCRECVERCAHCDDLICHGCTTSCGRCNEACCDRCVQRCDHCHRYTCPDCHDESLCNACRDELEDQLEQEEHDDESTLVPEDETLNTPTAPAPVA